MYDNRPISLVNRTRRPTNSYEIRRFHAGAELAAPHAAVEEFLTPARSASIASDVVVPFLQALVTAIVTGLVSLFPVIALDLPLLTSLLAGALAMGMTWLYLLGEHRRSLWQHERFEHEPEPPVVQPQQPPEIGVKLAVDEGPGHMRFGHLPIDHATLVTLAKALEGGRAFSVAGLTGRGKLLSRGEFETLRSWLLDSDYAHWKDSENRNLGIEFTNRGAAFWRALAES